MGVHLFGIRHHGPGCARSLLQALQALQPDCLLVEGPPEADGLAAFAGRAELAPPVALLLYAAAAPERAVFYPFAAYSPEWQALRYASEQAIPVRFCDLAQSHRLAIAPDPAPIEEADTIRADPLQWLAHAAGYGDTETWWDHLVEQWRDSIGLFDAVAEMMTAVRGAIDTPLSPLEARREAAMRTAIRAAEKEGHARIAVVCGAWHVPALAAMPSAKSDAELLKGLPKEKVLATWIPWSYGRLTFASGYGAGVASPGWYQHVWTHGEQAGLYWLTEVAALLRRQDLDASSAQVIDALRLADTLAALRKRPRAGLDELLEAVRAVFCQDSDIALRMIQRSCSSTTGWARCRTTCRRCRWCRTCRRSKSACACRCVPTWSISISTCVSRPIWKKACCCTGWRFSACRGDGTILRGEKAAASTSCGRSRGSPSLRSA
jgi:hypothetical protein